MIKTLFFAAICTCLFNTGRAQAQFGPPPPRIFMNDVEAYPLEIHSNYIADGTPYFNDEYLVGQLTGVDGTVFRNVKVKVDLADHHLQYINPNGKELVSTILIKQVKFTDYVFENGRTGELTLASYGGAINARDANVYEVIDSGRVTLLKRIIITYSDEKKYNSASITRTFTRNEALFAMQANGQPQKVNRGREAVLELLKDRKDQVESFVSKNKLNCKSEKDFAAVIRYYNSLP